MPLSDLANQDPNRIKNKRPWTAVTVLYLILTLYGFFLLYRSRTGEHILSPWQTIRPGYIYVFFAATLLLGCLIWFSGISKKILLILLMIHSFLFLSYLPLTHQLLYGADQWRHIANEEQILQGHWPAKPVLNNGTRAPRVEIGDFSYGAFWLVTVLIAKITSVSLLAINKWLLPILWSIVFPWLLYSFGRNFGWGDRQALGLAWLGSLPFSLQAGGAFTLPVNFGFLIWLIGVLLILRRLNNLSRRQIYWLALFGILSIFNYALFFILFWLGWGMAEAIKFKVPTATAAANAGQAGSRSDGKSSKFKVVMLTIIVSVAALVIPAIEVFAGYSQLPTAIDWLGQLKQLVGNFTAWYLASGPRPHDITAGNIIFNQLPSYAFVVNLFTSWRWWLVGFMILFFAAVIAGTVICWRKGGKHLWLAGMAWSIFLGYAISRYFLAGENILTRRLDSVLAIFFLLLAAMFLNWLFRRERGVLFSCFIVLLFSCGIAASYSLGPDTNTVSVNEYKAMQYIWSQEKTQSTHCVVADTYPLLALEAISAKEIIGGGFPINEYFAQPELAKLFAAATSRQSFFPQALSVSKADHCWLVAAFKTLGELPAVTFENVGVWRYGK